MIYWHCFEYFCAIFLGQELFQAVDGKCIELSSVLHFSGIDGRDIFGCPQHATRDIDPESI